MNDPRESGEEHHPIERIVPIDRVVMCLPTHVTISFDIATGKIVPDTVAPQPRTLGEYRYFERGDPQTPFRRLEPLLRAWLGLASFTVPAGTTTRGPFPYHHETETRVERGHIGTAMVKVFSSNAWEEISLADRLPYLRVAILKEAERMALEEKGAGSRGQRQLPTSLDGPVDDDEKETLGDRLADESPVSDIERAVRARVTLEELLRAALKGNRSEREVRVLAMALLRLEHGDVVDIDDVIEEAYPVRHGASPTEQRQISAARRDVKRRMMKRIRLVAGGRPRK